MAGERTVPLLPCGSIDETADFYRTLGFEVTYRQMRPNPYVALRREDLDLHFFGMPDFDPVQSYGSCLVYVPDVEVIHRAFAEGMRATYGKLLVAGIPRMTRPRRRRNTGNLSGFSIVDPGGNWIRIFQAAAPADAGPGSHPQPDGAASEPGEEPVGRLGEALRSAIPLGEGKGDHRQAARILDATLARHEASATVVEQVEALVYRAELAIRLDDGQTADALLVRARAVPLTEPDRVRLRDALANAEELERIRRAG
ncbi:VOC family protein [Plantactinospora sonchi]|uniref:VOC family protein n=1 Tax=Plantactinospora sonchi TaxID=1544735 RepID=A0ABU7RL44_9ACTN